MKCEKCGKSVLQTGYKDQHGAELWVGDIVWIHWKEIGLSEPCYAIARVISDCLDFGVSIEPGSIRINGEVASYVHQAAYIIGRPMYESENCIFLYRPKPKDRTITTTTTKDEFGHTHTDVS